MTRVEHLNLYREHNVKKIAALKAYREGIGNDEIPKSELQKYWDEYKSERKLADKHWGIAAAISTRQK